MTYNNYLVVYRIDMRELEKKVSEMLGLGWHCQGGVAVLWAKDELMFFQAMVKAS